MKAVLNFFLSRWFLSAIGVAIIAALVWFFGPLLDAFESWIVRAAIIAGLVLVWFAVNLLLHVRRRKKEDNLENGVTAATADPTQAASAEEAAAIREKLTTALGLLKKARGTRGFLYEQPWFILIGPPGAGKTTALLNSGLKFPLAAEMGQAAIAGVGGTRMCEWWFTENAVMIDTAGRYTTQDSAEAVDRAGWEAFLDLLKRTRARQPINGVLVAISLADIAQSTQAERLAHARAIRKRVKELNDRLGIRAPVYCLLSKADLLAGFTEFFDDLDRDKRDQVWGMTFPLTRQEAGSAGLFGAEFKLLVQRLNARLLDRLQAERSPDRRALIAGFPAQVVSIEQPVAEFLQEAFGGSRLDPAPFLRGVYLTSGTQEGTPIDRLTGALSRAFGVDQRRAPSLRPEQGRSYFLARLAQQVIFGEAMLVSAPPGARRKRMLIRAGVFSLLGLLALGGAGAFYASERSNNALIAESEAAVAAYTKAADAAALDPVKDSDLARVVPLLDQARDLPFGFTREKQDLARAGGFGLSQGDKLAAGARAIYRNALGRIMLPRLVLRLESQMRGALNQPDFLYEATRVYLMLGGQGPLDRDLVKTWMMLDWQRLYPGAPATPLRDDLAGHLTALLADPLPPVPLDGSLVSDARTVLSRIPLAQRVYARIKGSPEAQRLPEWRPGDAAGASGARVFLRTSGKPLTEGIPGFFTIDGLHKVLLPKLANVAREVAAESWVLGARTELDPASPALRTLEHDVIALYTRDYAAQWDGLLADLNIQPERSIAQAVQDLYILSSPQSPMRDLLAGITRQLTLSVPPPPPAGAAGAVQAAADAAKAAAQGAATNAASRLTGLLGQDTGPPPPPPGKDIDDKYKALRDFVGTGPGAPVDNILKLMNDLQQQLQKLASTPQGSPPPVGGGADPAALLQAEAARQPPPVDRWLKALSATGTTLRGGSAKQSAAAAYNGGGGAGGAGGGGGGGAPGPLCKQAVEGRYPFRAGAANEIPMGDFARLFAPGGLLDGFFNTQVRPFVDMTGKTWTAQTVDGIPPPVAGAELAKFQAAAVIRDLFFGAGATPSVRFDILPLRADSGTRQVTVDFDGVGFSYANGPTRSLAVNWPGTNGMTNVRIAFDPPPSNGNGVFHAEGPWALFRLFNMGTITPGASSERFTLSFKQGERSVDFDIRAGSVYNPFAPGVLQGFSCPNITP